MKKQHFEQQFSSALEQAAEYADAQLGYRVPRNFRIWLRGTENNGDALSAAEAIDALFLGEDRFYGIIDFGVIEVSDDATTVFVRASAHRPVPFERTWNDPPGRGPFKQLGARVPIKVASPRP